MTESSAEAGAEPVACVGRGRRLPQSQSPACAGSREVRISCPAWSEGTGLGGVQARSVGGPVFAAGQGRQTCKRDLPCFHTMYSCSAAFSGDPVQRPRVVSSGVGGHASARRRLCFRLPLFERIASRLLYTVGRVMRLAFVLGTRGRGVGDATQKDSTTSTGRDADTAQEKRKWPARQLKGSCRQKAQSTAEHNSWAPSESLGDPTANTVRDSRECLWITEKSVGWKRGSRSSAESGTSAPAAQAVRRARRGSARA